MARNECDSPLQKLAAAAAMNYDETDMARKYDAGRRLPEGTLRFWLDTLVNYVPAGDVRLIVDVGCGTGRFSAGLAEAFKAEVIGVDPAETMLAKAKERPPHPRVKLIKGDAERLPVERGAAGLVYLSMVYHHLGNPGNGAREFARVLRSGGFLCVRNSTVDHLDRFPYLEYFPTAIAVNRRRLPSQRDVIATMQENGFALVRHEVIEQRLADSFGELYDKIRQRALSDLAAITDAEFGAGVQRMKEALDRGDQVGPVTEPIDLFIFSKDGGASEGKDSGLTITSR